MATGVLVGLRSGLYPGTCGTWFRSGVTSASDLESGGDRVRRRGAPDRTWVVRPSDFAARAKRNVTERVGAQPRVTDLLRRWADGEHVAFEEALPLVYDELYRIARIKMARERAGHTLQPTALVNEAVAALMQWQGYVFTDRQHFLRAACLAMRRILVDYARTRAQDVQAEVSLSEDDVEVPGQTEASVVSAVALSAALDHLAAEDPKAAEIAGLRLFADLPLREIAELTAMPLPTVHRRWVYAKAMIQKELTT
ncbi:MAG: ECF-type sigma factor [Thermoanaerobaculia bacterium]